MTIQVGHPHECPTFFCPPPMRKSTGQRVNESTSLQVGESTSWCPIGRISPIRPMPPKAKAPLRHFFCQKLRHLWQYQSQYQLDTIPQTERTVPLVWNRPFGLSAIYGIERRSVDAHYLLQANTATSRGRGGCGDRTHCVHCSRGRPCRLVLHRQVAFGNSCVLLPQLLQRA